MEKDIKQTSLSLEEIELAIIGMDEFKFIHLKHFNDLEAGLSALLTAILEYLKEKK